MTKLSFILASSRVLVLLLCSLFFVQVQAIASTFTPTGSLGTNRYLHTATRLANGKVLVVGGTNSGLAIDVSALSSVEMYDPATGVWAPTGSLITARYYHTATLLQNGKVLVTGGYNGKTLISQCELYDPETGVWTSAGKWIGGRRNDNAILLQNGNVLIAGGYSRQPPQDECIYNVATNSWTSTGVYSGGAPDQTATLLNDGRVLFAGGGNGSYYCHLYNPTTNKWTSTGELNRSRTQHTATLLPNGMVLVSGGVESSRTILNSAELYDPTTGKWILTGNMVIARGQHTANLLPSGKVLVTGGKSDSSYPISAELYDPSTGAWTPTGNLQPGRATHTSTSLSNGSVLVAGGEGDRAGTYRKDALLYGSGTSVGVTLSKLEPSTDNTVEAHVTSAGFGTNPTIHFAWSVNDVEKQTGPESTYDLSRVGFGDRGQKLSVTVTVSSSGFSESATISTSIVGIETASVSLSSSEPKTNDTLVATATTTGFMGTPTLNYVWSVAGVVKQSGEDSSFDLSQSGSGDKGQIVKVFVTATLDDATATSSASTTIVNSPPVAQNSTHTGIIGQPFNAQLFVTDADGDPLHIVLRAAPELPPGISIFDAKSLTGTPEVASTITLNLAVSDLNTTAAYNGVRFQTTLIFVESGGDRPTNVSATPSAGVTGPEVPNTITTVYRDSNGASDIVDARLLIRNSLGGANSLTGRYLNGKLYLSNDSGTGFLGGFSPGSANVISNSQGSLDCSKTTVVGVENELTINWKFIPLPHFTGPKGIFGLVIDKARNQSGWDYLNKWNIVTINLQPETRKLSPLMRSSNAGQPQTFSVTYQDGNGAGDIIDARIFIGNNLQSSRPLVARFHGGKLYLLSNDRKSFIGGFSPGSNQVISNLLGTLDCSKTTIEYDGDKLLVHWNLIPKSAFSGSYSIYFFAVDKAFKDSGWNYSGDWQVTGPLPDNPFTSSVTPASSTSPANTSVTLTAMYMDPNGANTIKDVRILIGANLERANTLTARYSGNKLYLASDDGLTFIGGFTPGSDNTISNSQGTLDCSKSWVSYHENQLFIGWEFIPKVSFPGSKTIFSLVTDDTNTSVGWDNKASWTVTVPGSLNQAASVSPKPSAGTS